MTTNPAISTEEDAPLGSMVLSEALALMTRITAEVAASSQVDGRKWRLSDWDPPRDIAIVTNDGKHFAVRWLYDDPEEGYIDLGTAAEWDASAFHQRYLRWCAND